VGATPDRSVPVGELRRLGDHALLLGVPDAAAARRLARVLTAASLEGVAEVVGGLATVMVAFDPMTGDVDTRRLEVAELLEESFGLRVDGGDGEDDGGNARLVEIPCTFDGPDLVEVATVVGSSPEAVVAMMTAGPLTVATVGFSPGFAYLAGLPPALGQVRRRSRPRPSVPAGSVALANGHAAVYPSASPGGWQLIGHTEEPLFSPWEPPYARLAPGDRVQFVRCATAPGRARGRSTPDDADRRTTAPPPGARPVFDVEEPGLRSVLQDGGRKGLAALGVPAATPADPDSFRLANELVGNPVGACTLEVTAHGPTLRCLSPTFVAVVGGAPDLHLEGQPMAPGRVVPVTAGQQLLVGPLRGGFRCYVAMAGGFVGPALFGSSSSDQLAGLGAGPIERGGQLWGATMKPPLGDHLRADVSGVLGPGDTVALRVLPGPHHERFAPGTFAALSTMRFTVEPASNRVGVRLRRDPDTPTLQMATGAPAELDSQGVVTGAVQVPPDGEPVILLTDHATLGGYPVVAVVAAVDHGVLGQCAPGTTVLLVPCDHDQAAEALRAHRRTLDLAVVGHYPLAVE